jgi:hypothetical protein
MGDVSVALISEDYVAHLINQDCYETTLKFLNLTLHGKEGRGPLTCPLSEGFLNMFIVSRKKDLALNAPGFVRYLGISVFNEAIYGKVNGRKKNVINAFCESKIFSKFIVTEKEVRDFNENEFDRFDRNFTTLYIDLKKCNPFELYLFLHLVRNFKGQVTTELCKEYYEILTKLTADEAILFMCFMQSPTFTEKMTSKGKKALKIYPEETQFETLHTFRRGISKRAVRELVLNGSLEGFYKDIKALGESSVCREPPTSLRVNGRFKDIDEYDFPFYGDNRTYYKRMVRFFSTKPPLRQCLSKIQFKEIPPLCDTELVVGFIRDVIRASCYKRKVNVSPIQGIPLSEVYTITAGHA